MLGSRDKQSKTQANCNNSESETARRVLWKYASPKTGSFQKECSADSEGVGVEIPGSTTQARATINWWRDSRHNAVDGSLTLANRRFFLVKHVSTTVCGQGASIYLTDPVFAVLRWCRRVLPGLKLALASLRPPTGFPTFST